MRWRCDALGWRVREVPGVRPGGRPTFLRAQESRQRKRPCSVAPSLSEGVPCDARNQRPAQNSLRSLRSLRSDSCAESVIDAGFARASGSCASRLLQRGTPEQPQQPTAKPEGRSLRGIRLAPFSAAEQRKALRAFAQRTSTSDSAQLFEHSVAARVLRGPSRPEQRREPAALLRAVRSGGASLPTFLSTQESRSPAGAKTAGFAEGKSRRDATGHADRRQDILIRPWKTAPQGRLLVACRHVRSS